MAQEYPCTHRGCAQYGKIGRRIRFSTGDVRAFLCILHDGRLKQLRKLGRTSEKDLSDFIYRRAPTEASKMANSLIAKEKAQADTMATLKADNERLRKTLRAVDRVLDNQRNDGDTNAQWAAIVKARQAIALAGREG